MAKKKQKEQEKEIEEIPTIKKANNLPVAKFGTGLVQLTVWNNTDKQTGNEWQNFVLKIGRKDKQTGVWTNSELRFGTHQIVEIRDWLTKAIDFCRERGIRL